MKRFLTTGEAAKRLGVGLNTVKRWIASGAIHAVQTPGGHWRIPQSELEMFIKKHLERPSSPERDVARVLVVDDDPTVCRLLKAVLEEIELPLEAKCAHDGYSGLIQIGLWQPDLLLLDIFMPKLDGLEVLRRLRAEPELNGTMRIIVITAAFDRPEIRDVLAEIKPDALLPKPLEIHQLMNAVHGCLANRFRHQHVA